MQEAAHTHETTDASSRPIVLAAAGLAVAVALTGLAAFALLRLLEAPASREATPPVRVNTNVQGPRIEEYPAIELNQLRKQEDETLSSYGWVDKQAGRVRIPIDRAMELQLERGFPVRKAGAK